MKKILLINLLTIIAHGLTAQIGIGTGTPQKVGDYYTANLDAYVGTWEYSDANCTFRIYLKKGKDYYSKGGPLCCEAVYGGHYIKQAGANIPLVDLTNAVQKATDENRKGLTITADNGKKEASQVNPNELVFVFRDDLKGNKRGIGRLTLIPGNPAKLRWHIQKTAERGLIIRIDNEPSPVIHEGWTVPEDVILTKISDTIVLPPQIPIIKP